VVRRESSERFRCRRTELTSSGCAGRPAGSRWVWTAFTQLTAHMEGSCPLITHTVPTEPSTRCGNGGLRTLDRRVPADHTCPACLTRHTHGDRPALGGLIGTNGHAHVRPPATPVSAAGAIEGGQRWPTPITATASSARRSGTSRATSPRRRPACGWRRASARSAAPQSTGSSARPEHRDRPAPLTPPRRTSVGPEERGGDHRARLATQGLPLASRSWRTTALIARACAILQDLERAPRQLSDHGRLSTPSAAFLWTTPRELWITEVHRRTRCGQRRRRCRPP